MTDTEPNGSRFVIGSFHTYNGERVEYVGPTRSKDTLIVKDDEGFYKDVLRSNTKPWPTPAKSLSFDEAKEAVAREIDPGLTIGNYDATDFVTVSRRQWAAAVRALQPDEAKVEYWARAANGIVSLTIKEAAIKLHAIDDRFPGGLEEIEAAVNKVDGGQWQAAVEDELIVRGLLGPQHIDSPRKAVHELIEIVKSESKTSAIKPVGQIEMIELGDTGDTAPGRLKGFINLTAGWHKVYLGPPAQAPAAAAEPVAEVNTVRQDGTPILIWRDKFVPNRGAKLYMQPPPSPPVASVAAELRELVSNSRNASAFYALPGWLTTQLSALADRLVGGAA